MQGFLCCHGRELEVPGRGAVQFHCGYQSAFPLVGPVLMLPTEGDNPGEHPDSEQPQFTGRNGTCVTVGQDKG